MDKWVGVPSLFISFLPLCPLPHSASNVGKSKPKNGKGLHGMHFSR